MLVKMEENASILPSMMHSTVSFLFDLAAVSAINSLNSCRKPELQLSSIPWKIKVGRSLSHSSMVIAFAGFLVFPGSNIA